jgi:hypothetical protein
MKIFKNFQFLAILLTISSCAVKFPNQPYPQGVTKIYISTDNGGDWGNKFFQKKLQTLLKEYKIEWHIGEKTKSLFMQKADFNPSEQQKKTQDIAAFKPDIILELTAYNYAITSQMESIVNKTSSETAVVKDTADLKKAIEKVIEIQDNIGSKKLTNYARVSAFLYLPNQYSPVWYTSIVVSDPDVKANTAEGSFVKAAQSLVAKMVEAKIIKP